MKRIIAKALYLTAAAVVLFAVGVGALFVGGRISDANLARQDAMNERRYEEFAEQSRRLVCAQRGGIVSPASVAMLIEQRCIPGLTWQRYFSSLDTQHALDELRHSLVLGDIARLEGLAAAHASLATLPWNGESPWQHVSGYNVNAGIVAWLADHFGTDDRFARDVYRASLAAGDTTVVQVFLDHGYDLNVPLPDASAECPGRRMPIRLASHHIWLWLIENGADPTRVTCDERPLLIDLIRRESIPRDQKTALARLLLEKANARNIDHALFVAVAASDPVPELVSLLLDKGADPLYTPVDYDRSILRMSYDDAHTVEGFPITDLLLEHVDRSALLAALCDHFPGVRLLTPALISRYEQLGASREDMTQCESGQHMPLHEAIFVFGRFDLQQALGLDVSGEQAAELATEGLWRLASNDLPIAPGVIGARLLNDVFTSGEASEAASIEMVRWFMARGADPDRVMKNSFTSRSYVIRSYRRSEDCAYKGFADRCKRQRATLSAWLDVMEEGHPFYGPEDTLRIE